MNKKEYFDRIDALANEAGKLLDEGKLDEARSKRVEAERLMNDWEQYALGQANESALMGIAPVNLLAESVEVINGKIIDRTGGSSKMQTNLVDTEEYKDAFVRTLQGTGTEQMKNMVTVATGAAVIPTSIYDQVLENIRKQQGILPYVRILNIPGKVSIPLSDINTPAAWHVEGESIADTTKPPTNLVLSGHELCKLFSMSAASKAMSIPAFESYLVEELTRCTGDALNQSVFTGTGNGQPTGIDVGVVFDATNSITTAVKSLAANDLVDAMGLMASNFRQRAMWVMNSKTMFKYIVSLMDNTGRPMFGDSQTTEMPLMILGKSAVIDDFCPDDTIYLMDSSNYIVNFSQPITVLKSDEAGFATNTTLYKSTTVVDGKPSGLGIVKVIIPQA